MRPDQSRLRGRRGRRFSGGSAPEGPVDGGGNGFARAPRSGRPGPVGRRGSGRARVRGRSLRAGGRPLRNGVARRRRRGRGRGPSAAHLGHDGAGEDRPSDARQRPRLGPVVARGPGSHRSRPVHQRAALVPRPRPDRHDPGFPGSGREHRVHRRVRGRPLPRLAHRVPAHVVLGGSDHAPGDPGLRRAGRRTGRGREPAALHSLRLGALAAPRPRRAGAYVPHPSHRVLRHDGDRLRPHRLQSPPAPPAQGRLGGRPRRLGRGHRGRRGSRAGRRPDGRGRRARSERDAWLRRRLRCGSARGWRWLVQDGRPGPSRSGRLPVPHRPEQRDHQPRRGKGLAPGSGRRAHGSSRGGPGRHLRRAPRHPG